MSALANKALTLSLIIPAYNEENQLRACLEAVAAQSVAPDEVIVVNNNSTDKTADIAHEFPFVTLINESKQGIVYARDAGFNKAKCDIIGRIDADTILPPNWIRRVQQYYSHEQNSKHALTGGGYFYNIRFKHLNGWVQSQIAYRLNKIILGHYILWGSNMAFTRAQWNDVKNDVCVRDDIHEDLDLAIHLHRKGYGIDYKPSLKVGVMLKRVYSNRPQLRGHMARWPKTLRTHGYKLWWMGVLGNVVLWYIFQPFSFIVEYFGRLILRLRPLDD